MIENSGDYLTGPYTSFEQVCANDPVVHACMRMNMELKEIIRIMANRNEYLVRKVLVEKTFEATCRNTVIRRDDGSIYSTGEMGQ